MYKRSKGKVRRMKRGRTRDTGNVTKVVINSQKRNES